MDFWEIIFDHMLVIGRGILKNTIRPRLVGNLVGNLVAIEPRARHVWYQHIATLRAHQVLSSRFFELGFQQRWSLHLCWSVVCNDVALVSVCLGVAIMMLDDAPFDLVETWLPHFMLAGVGVVVLSNVIVGLVHNVFWGECEDFREYFLEGFRGYIREYIREDIREDIRVDIRGDIREDVREDVREDIRDDIREDIRENIREDVREYIRGNSREDICGGIRGDIRKSIREDIREDIGDVLCDGNREILREDICEILCGGHCEILCEGHREDITRSKQ